jgi:hypothetical protein
VIKSSGRYEVLIGKFDVYIIISFNYPEEKDFLGELYRIGSTGRLV